MKILKHKNTYLFLNINEDDDATIFEIKNNKIEWDYLNNATKFVNQKLKKGFVVLEITQEVLAKTKALTDKFELNKPHFFVLKNSGDFKKSSLVQIKVNHNVTSDYSLESFSEDNDEFGTVADFLNGYLPVERGSYEAKNILSKLDFHLKMLFTLGFELKSKKKIFSLGTGRNIENEIFEGQVYKMKEELQFADAQYTKIATNKDKLCIELVSYISFEKDGVVKMLADNYVIADTEKELDDILKMIQTQNENKFEKPISEKDFFAKYTLDEKPKYFELPNKIDVILDKFPFVVPKKLVVVKDFLNTNYNENSLYFFANTTNENPLEWQVAFITCTDLKADYFAASKVFQLKDFNKIISNIESKEVRYSDDKKNFVKKLNKKYKKAALKPIDTKVIFEKLSGKTLVALQKQDVAVKPFTRDASVFGYYYDVYPNYACVRYGSNQYWQFFNEDSQREKWLIKHQTKETKLYKKDVEYIEEYTQKAITQSENNFDELKEYYIEHPLLANIFDSEYNVRDFNKFDIKIEKSLHIKGDYVLKTENIHIIEGDLIVDGTLFIGGLNASFSRPYIIIKGNLKAKNFIAYRSAYEVILVEGNIEIENITYYKYRVYAKNAKTKIFLNEEKHTLDVSSNFKYETEVSTYSTAITNKEVIKKDDYGNLKFIPKKLNEFLVKDIPFIAKDYKNAAVDEDEYYKNQFENGMKDWGNYYPELAGCEQLGISEDNEIKGNCIWPGGGDWVVYDIRCQSGTYGVSHDDASICKLKIKEPKEHKVDYSLPVIKRKVNAVTLMERYQWISGLFMSWAHRKTVSYHESLFKDLEDVKTKYEDEKSTFVEDPHLAMYWLLHFGITLDKRYAEVEKIVIKNKLEDKIAFFKAVVAFFKKTDAFYNMNLGYDEKTEDLFLMRRSYLIFWAHSYKNYNPENLDLWWKSITIQPKIDEHLIVRMRWLKKNLKKCDLWNAFDEHIKNEPKDIPFLSYIFACNPNNSDAERTKYADILIQELDKYKKYWETDRSFAEVLIWDVREFITNKEKLAEVASYCFIGNETSKEYQDIQEVLGIKPKNIDEELGKINTLFEGYDRFDTPDDKKQDYYNNVTNFLEQLEPEILTELVVNVKNYELKKPCFIYLWEKDIPNKKEALVKLFISLRLRDYDIKELFKDNYNLIKDENDPNLEIAKAFLAIPKKYFTSTYGWKDSKSGAAMFFLKIAHLPSVFEYLISIINTKPTADNKAIIEAVYTHLFSEESESKINPTLKFSKEQIEKMLAIITDGFLTFGCNEEAESAIYYCSNPLAESWIRYKYNNKEWLKQFAHIDSGFEPLSELLNSCFKSALEFIEAQKHFAYLEFKNEKSHKFWEIEFYEERYRVTYGKIGTTGRKYNRYFKTKEECFNAGDKLVASKLKKGKAKRLIKRENKAYLEGVISDFQKNKDETILEKFKFKHNGKKDNSFDLNFWNRKDLIVQLFENNKQADRGLLKWIIKEELKGYKIDLPIETVELTAFMLYKHMLTEDVYDLYNAKFTGGILGDHKERIDMELIFGLEETKAFLQQEKTKKAKKILEVIASYEKYKAKYKYKNREAYIQYFEEIKSEDILDDLDDLEDEIR